MSNDPRNSLSTPPISPRNRLGASLLLSLAINFVLAGVIAAPLLIDRFSSGPRPIEGGRFVQLLPATFVKSLAKDRRATLREAIKPWAHRYRALRYDSKAKVEAVARALVAEPYLPNQTSVAVEEFTTLNQQAIAAGNETVLKAISLLTPRERTELALLLRERSRMILPAPASR